MFDAVINHVSKESLYFQQYLQQKPGYETFFMDLPQTTDLSRVTRPRTSPILTPFETKAGVKYVWTTFSEDQVDLNYANPEVLIEVMDVLLFYVHQHSRMIRFDAVGFIWKEIGSTCMHHEYAHEIVKIMRSVIDRVSKGVKIITETNVKHTENISYFGNGFDEASLVYQFPLPPLVVQAYVSGKTTFLMQWLSNLEPTSSETTFFNFLSSHDGIGLRPLEGIVPDHQKEEMMNHLMSRGAKINYRQGPKGDRVAYECCITLTDALSDNKEDDMTRAKKMIGAHVILLVLQGLPAIYIHSLLGSRNDEDGFASSGINRRINREKLFISQVEAELNDSKHLRSMIFKGLSEVIKLRKNEKLFNPKIPQRTVDLGSDVFAIERFQEDERILIIVNVTDQVKTFFLNEHGQDMITNKAFHGHLEIEGFGFGIYKITKNG
jgi:sucrose phosphorylase